MTLNQITTWLKIKKRDEKKPIVSKYCKHKKNIVKIFPVPKPNAVGSMCRKLCKKLLLRR